MRISISGILFVAILMIGLAALYSFHYTTGNEQQVMDEVIEAWHDAAARGDSAAFFGRMTKRQYISARMNPSGGIGHPWRAIWVGISMGRKPGNSYPTIVITSP